MHKPPTKKHNNFIAKFILIILLTIYSIYGGVFCMNYMNTAQINVHNDNGNSFPMCIDPRSV